MKAPTIEYKMLHGQISPRKRPFEQALSSQQVDSKKTRFEEPIRTRRGPWTADEDELLTNLVKKFGTKKWALIAELVPGRVGKQCRERYLNHLRTDVKKTAWTEEEDMTLIRAQQELGNRWSAIARLLPGRPENSVKNRWNSLCNKRKRWSGDYEDSEGSTSADEHSVDNSDNTNSPPNVQRRMEPLAANGLVVAGSVGELPYLNPGFDSAERGLSPRMNYCADPNSFIWSLYSHRQQQQQQSLAQMFLPHSKPIMPPLNIAGMSTPVQQQQQQPQFKCLPQATGSQLSFSEKSSSPTQESPSTTESNDKRESSNGLMLLATLCS